MFNDGDAKPVKIKSAGKPEANIYVHKYAFCSGNCLANSSAVNFAAADTNGYNAVVISSRNSVEEENGTSALT